MRGMNTCGGAMVPLTALRQCCSADQQRMCKAAQRVLRPYAAKTRGFRQGQERARLHVHSAQRDLGFWD